MLLKHALDPRSVAASHGCLHSHDYLIAGHLTTDYDVDLARLSGDAMRQQRRFLHSRITGQVAVQHRHQILKGVRTLRHL
jgi:hypothetical protein